MYNVSDEMIRELDFSKVVADLRNFRDYSIINSPESHCQQEAAYHLVSLLLGLDPFLKNQDYGVEYIKEKCDKIKNIVTSHYEDKSKIQFQWHERHQHGV